MGAALKYKTTQSIPQQVGETARLKVVKGSDQGSVFILKTPRASIGRGEENDVILLDVKSSRKHAELSREQNGLWSVKDLGSANGIIHNGAVTRNASLKKGDVITVGDTSLEFLPAAVMQLVNQNTFQSPVNTTGLGTIPGITIASGSQNNEGGLLGSLPPEKRKIIIYVLIGAGLWFFLEEEPKKQPTKTDKKEEKKDKKSDELDLSNYLPQNTNGKTDAAEMFFRAGFREFRERNYLRAKTQFETALQIAPYHRLASIYMKHCEKAIEEEVSFHLIQGKKNLDSGKYKAAKGHFEAVIRLLHRDTENPHYTEAKDQLKLVLFKMKGVIEP